MLTPAASMCAFYFSPAKSLPILRKAGPTAAQERAHEDAKLVQYHSVLGKISDATAELGTLQEMERNGTKDVPFVVPVKGSLARDPYVCSAGQQFPFSLEDGAETIRGTMLRSVGINGGGFDARSTVDNMVYQASRLPQPFDASAMPMTHTVLQHMRAGLGVEEQMEFIAPSGFHHEPGTLAARLGFSKRGRFSGFLGAVGANGRVEGKTRDLVGIRSAVTEALALLRKIARGYVAHPFYCTPFRQFGAKAKTPNTKAMTSVEGNRLQPLAPDLAYRADIRGEAVGRTRRVSTTSAADDSVEVYGAFPGLNPLPAFSPTTVTWGPPTPELKATDDDELAALLHECLRQVEKDAPAGASIRLSIEDIKEVVRKKAISQVPPPGCFSTPSASRTLVDYVCSCGDTCFVL